MGFKKDLRSSSFFRYELIAGGFLSKIFPIFIFCYEKRIINKNLFLFFTFFIFIGIGISGERSALIIFLIINLFYFIFVNLNFVVKNLFVVILFFLIFAISLFLNSNRVINIKKVFFNEDYLNLSHYPVIYLKDIKEIHLTQNINNNVNLSADLGYIIDINDNKKIINFSNLENKKIKGLKLFIRQDNNFFSHFSRIENLNEKIIYSEINKLEYSDKHLELMLKSEKKVTYNYIDSGWGSHQLTAINMFKENILIGSGPNSFRFKCFEEKFFKINSFNIGKNCNTHPHNLHVEMLQGIGILGYSSFILFLISIYFFLTKNNNLHVKEKKMIIIIILCFFPIIIPTGSFFSTSMMNRIFFSFLIIQLINSYARFSKN